jgi:hypothetical protein
LGHFLKTNFYEKIFWEFEMLREELGSGMQKNIAKIFEKGFNKK